MALTGEQRAVSNQLDIAIFELKDGLTAWEHGDVGGLLRGLQGATRAIQGLLLCCEYHNSKLTRSE